MVGRHHLHHSEAPSNNGECLLDLTTSFGFCVANTFFPHRPGHLVPSSHPALVFKDYIMCSHSLMCGVLNCKVFTNVCHGNNDHWFLVTTL